MIAGGDARQNAAGFELEAWATGMKIEEVKRNRGTLARSILEDLPDWFGRTDTREDYIREAANLPMFAAVETAGNAVGFLSLKAHTSVAVEAYVLSVLHKKHRQGIGRALWGRQPNGGFLSFRPEPVRQKTAPNPSTSKGQISSSSNRP